MNRFTWADIRRNSPIMPFIGNAIPDRSDPTSYDARRTLFAAVAGLLAAVLALTLVGLAHPPDPDSASAEGATGEQETALAQWEALWADIDRRGEAALQPERSDSSLRSAGDTVFMRYRNLWRDVDETTRRAFQMAALTNDPDAKIARLQPLATAGPAPIRSRALAEIARIRLRQWALDDARANARQALAIPGLEPRFMADAYFILGYAALEARDLDGAETALAEAVARDPGFWDARQTQLLVLSRQLGQPRQATAACINRTRLMIENLSALPTLAQDRTQFRDIADRFAAQSARANPAFSLLSGLGYLWAGDRDKARAALAETGKARGALPRRCEALLVAKAEELLARGF